MLLSKARVSADWESEFTTREFTSHQWENQRETVTKLYLQDNLKLPEVRKVMAQENGFYANKRQFDRKIKQWGLNKNLKRKDAIAMLKIQKKRKIEYGKSTQFTFNGRPITQEKLVRHWSNESIPEPALPRIATPDYVQYWTPPSSEYGTPKGVETLNLDPPCRRTSSPQPECIHERTMSLLNTDNDLLYPPIEDVQMEIVESTLFKADPRVSMVSQSLDSYPRSDTPPAQSSYLAYIDEEEQVTFTIPLADLNAINPPPNNSKAIETTIDMPPTKHNESGKYLLVSVWEAGEKLRSMAHQGDEVEVRLLLEQGTDASAADGRGLTPLHMAASNGNEVVVQLLLAKGADISAITTSSETPLHMAASNGHEVVVQLLLEKGAGSTDAQYRLKTPLHMAVSNGHEAVVRLLLGDGMDVSATDFHSGTPLHIAAFRGDEVVVRLLLENGADTSATDYLLQTPLHRAVKMGHETVVRLLLDKCVDTSTKKQLLNIAASRGHEAVVRILLENDADTSSTDHYLQTPLHIAVSRGDEAVVRLLLEKGANVFAITKSLKTPLDMAVDRGHGRILGLLLEMGTNYYYPQTLLQIAASRGDEVVVRLLLNKNTDTSATCPSLRTPLHMAASNGHKEVVRLLLEKGADISAMDCYSQTPLHLAASSSKQLSGNRIWELHNL